MHAKTLAQSIMAPPPLDEAGSGSFFVPADGPAPEIVNEKVEENDEPPQTLLQMLTENLSLSLLSRSRADSSDREARHWDRLIVGYLGLLSQWLWDDPAAVRDFLNAGGLGVVRSRYFPCVFFADSGRIYSLWSRSIIDLRQTLWFQDSVYSYWAYATSSIVNLGRSLG